MDAETIRGRLWIIYEFVGISLGKTSLPGLNLESSEDVNQFIDLLQNEVNALRRLAREEAK